VRRVRRVAPRRRQDGQESGEEIEASPAFTASSLIFVTFDEDDYSSTLGCCDSPHFPNGLSFGGGHTVTIVISGTPGGDPLDD